MNRLAVRNSSSTDVSIIRICIKGCKQMAVASMTSNEMVIFGWNEAEADRHAVLIQKAVAPIPKKTAASASAQPGHGLNAARAMAVAIKPISQNGGRQGMAHP